MLGTAGLLVLPGAGAVGAAEDDELDMLIERCGGR